MSNPYQDLIKTLVPKQSPANYVKHVEARYYAEGYEKCLKCNNFINDKNSREYYRKYGECLNCDHVQQEIADAMDDHRLEQAREEMEGYNDIK